MDDINNLQEQDFRNWPHSDLVKRVKLLEKALGDHGIVAPLLPLNHSGSIEAAVPSTQPLKKKRIFNPKQYSTRLIALKIAYRGSSYNGFEYHANNTTPLPTIEEKIFESLLKSRLVSPSESQLVSSSNSMDISAQNAISLWPGDDSVQYSKCGRTDRGVSAFGQVIGLKVRSNRLVLGPNRDQRTAQDGQDSSSAEPFDDIKDELPYVQIINRLLPEDIRVLAWCPNPPEGFSARYNCQARHYRYFFTNPAIPPINLSSASAFDEGRLNIPNMRKAASYFLGEHDFRNFCKLDPSKQITNFKRHIFHSDIEKYSPLPPTCFASTGIGAPHITYATLSPQPEIYFFHLQGTAFLWHQVRHMTAILFLVGQGLEQPEIVKHLLDADSNPCKPSYEMADDKPLVLWDCIFPENEVQWVYGENTKNGIRRDGLVDSVWRIWHRTRIDEVLMTGLVDKVYESKREYDEGKLLLKKRKVEENGKEGPGCALTHSNTFGKAEKVMQEKKDQPTAKSQIIVDGGGRVLLRGKYVPVLQRKRQEHIDILNERYRDKNPEKVGAMGKAKKEKLLRMRGDAEGVEEDDFGKIRADISV